MQWARLGQLAMVGVEACQIGDLSICFAIGGIDMGDARRIGALRSVVRRICPQPTGLGDPAAGIEHRHWSSRRRTALTICASLPRRCSSSGHRWKAAFPPVHQRRAIEFDVLTGENLRLPVQRQEIRVLVDQDQAPVASVGSAPSISRSAQRGPSPIILFGGLVIASAPLPRLLHCCGVRHSVRISASATSI
jgi:hypothetical protein